MTESARYAGMQACCRVLSRKYPQFKWSPLLESADGTVRPPLPGEVVWGPSGRIRADDYDSPVNADE